MTYHCPNCGRREEKESFGYPSCRGRTMDKVAPGAITPRTTITPEFTNLRLWEMATEVDYHADDLSDRETDFIITCIEYRDERRRYSDRQKKWLIDLWSKYCA